MSASDARRNRRLARKNQPLPQMPAEMAHALTALLEHVAPLSRAEQEAHGVFHQPDGTIKIDLHRANGCQHDES